MSTIQYVDFLPPYLAKKHSILAKFIKEDEKGKLYQIFLFDKTKSIQDIKIDISSFIEGQKARIGGYGRNNVDSFDELFKIIYPDVELNSIDLPDAPNETPIVKEPIVDSKQLVSQKTYSGEQEPILTIDEVLKTIPIEKLESELRQRYLQKTLTGTLTNIKNEVKFSLDRLEWPEGVYKISISYIEDITTKYLESARNENNVK